MPCSHKAFTELYACGPRGEIGIRIDPIYRDVIAVLPSGRRTRAAVADTPEIVPCIPLTGNDTASLSRMLPRTWCRVRPAA
ncbi:MAG: hypothetical protein APR53_09950 [Methanoculleus sp. SDB]|nr:MAG: hypothetical protein APR53_09950 [Methanoculleus sp. SDB]